MTPKVHQGSADFPSPSPRPVVTIGNFDGVHRGHRTLLSRVVEVARELGRPALVYTFDPTPGEVMRAEDPPVRIQDIRDRVEALGAVGIDHVVVERFSRDYATHTAEWFAGTVLEERLDASAVVVGWDWRFGRGRQGDFAWLSQRMKVPVEQVEAFSVQEEVVSSTRIRNAVQDGRVEDAAALLGRPHRLRGVVIEGDRRGRLLGFPTANLRSSTDLLPAYGVYACRVRLADGSVHIGVANRGGRPTFAGAGPSLEVHLLDYQGELYGQELVVDLIAHLRGEQRFDGPDALVAQIDHDVTRTRLLLA